MPEYLYCRDCKREKTCSSFTSGHGRCDECDEAEARKAAPKTEEELAVIEAAITWSKQVNGNDQVDDLALLDAVRALRELTEVKP